MSLLDQIQVFENVFTEEQHQKIIELSERDRWGFQTSTDFSPDKKFLIMHLLSNKFISEDLFNVIKKKIGENYKVHRAYINGQFFGMSGFPHIDSEFPNRYTFLVYLNKDWDFLWGGQTIFFDRYYDIEKKLTVINSQKFRSFIPVWNTALMFPSNIHHYAESPTKDCLHMRMTLTYKLERIV